MQPGALEVEAVQPSIRRVAGLPTVGIIGGGQLGRMLALAGHTMGIRSIVLDPDPASPAAQVVPIALTGSLAELASLRELARLSDLVTFENEWVDPALVRALEIEGYSVWPSSQTLGYIQDKFHQRRHLQQAGLPVPRFRAVDRLDQLADWQQWPLVLKTRRQGYDGHGVRIVPTAAQLAAAWEELAGQPLIVEAFVPFERELAVMVASSASGEVRSFPVVETRQQQHVCHTVIAPAPVSAAVHERAAAIAVAAIEAIAGVGIFGVELFVEPDGTVTINELAPRPHNSGHYTIDACDVSQFEQHLRAVLGWPLAAATMHSPAAVMVNILAQTTTEQAQPDLAAALALPGVKVHWYGKHAARPGRKLGHLTAVAADWQIALERALSARQVLGV